MQASVWPSAQALRRRLYEILHHGTIGDHSSRIVGRFIVASDHRQPGGGDAAIGARPRASLRPRLQRRRDPVAGRLHPRVRAAGVGRGRRSRLPPSGAAARPLAIRLKPCRDHRPAGGAAVLVRLGIAGRSARRPGIPGGAVSQAHPLLGRHELAPGRHLYRAPGFVRLLHHPDRGDPDRRQYHAPGRRRCAARKIRDHSGRHVVGDRHAGHARLWRRGSDHARSAAWSPASPSSSA